MIGVTVRPERDDDAAAIRAVVEAAFGSPVEGRLVDAIRASDGFIPDLSIVAESDGEVVGHVMTSYVGLRTPDGITIDLPAWAPPEAAQVMCLRDHDPTLRGHVVYPPAFDVVPHD